MYGARVRRKRGIDLDKAEISQQYGGVSFKSRRQAKEHINNEPAEGAENEQASRQPRSSKETVEQGFITGSKRTCTWHKITNENLALHICPEFYNEAEASELLAVCEQELAYNVGELATVKLFGKRFDIRRKQVAHGDPGLNYTFSGKTVPARPWTPILTKIRDEITQVTGYTFNFVLINRYKDGLDYVGEHKDNQKELVCDHPIASLTLGQSRDFVFKHQDSRGKNAKRKLDPVTVKLEHGMLLLMNHPTNSYWYHSLPRRTSALGVRVSMTFRKLDPSQCKPAVMTDQQ